MTSAPDNRINARYCGISVPEEGEQITARNGLLQVSDKPIVVVIKGDGIGRSYGGVLGVTDSALKVLDAAVEKAYRGRRKIHWLEAFAGESALEKYFPSESPGSVSLLPPAEQQRRYLPEETLRALDEFYLGIKGPLATPTGKGFPSVNVTLRRRFDLYACVRPIIHFPGAPSPNVNAEGVDLVVFRENTEDVYRGIEFKAGSAEQRRLQQILIHEFNADLDPAVDYALGIKPLSAAGSKRLVRQALRYALDRGYKTVTLVHKGNIMKHTEGAFREWGYEVARGEFRDEIVTEDELYSCHAGKLPEGKLLLNDRIADAMMQHVQQQPRSFGVIACPNLNGDYISDELAALVGGLGIAPGGNINYETGRALFEATHGTAPDIAGKDLANPSSLILSGAMLLDYIGWKEAATIVRNAVGSCISEAAEGAKRRYLARQQGSSGLRDPIGVKDTIMDTVKESERGLVREPLPVTGDLAKQFRGCSAADGMRCSEYVAHLISRM